MSTIAAPAGTQAGAAAGRPISIVRCAAASLLLLALLMVGFIGYLLGASGLQEAGAQSRLYSTLANRRSC